MDEAKILRMCNDIEDEVTDIAFNSTHKHIYDCCESIREYLKEIAAEITSPPKTNADRIRQMTDEELAALIANENDFCSLCAYKSDTPICTKPLAACTHGFYEWLKQEVSEDAGTDD